MTSSLKGIEFWIIDLNQDRILIQEMSGGMPGKYYEIVAEAPEDRYANLTIYELKPKEVK